MAKLYWIPGTSPGMTKKYKITAPCHSGESRNPVQRLPRSTRLFVIPAKAGTHSSECHTHRRKSLDPGSRGGLPLRQTGLTGRRLSGMTGGGYGIFEIASELLLPTGHTR